MPLPRCPACGSLIFPSAREGGDVSPLCEQCQTEVKRTGRPLGPALRFASPAPEVHEEVVEPSGPFLLPDALPPDEVLDHLGTRRPVGAGETVVVEPSGPFVLPGRPAVPEAAAMLAAGEAPAGEAASDEPVRSEDEVVEPSGPFLVPGVGGAIRPPVSLEAAAAVVEARLQPDPAAVLAGVAHSAPRRPTAVDGAAPSVVIDPSLGLRGEATVELPRDGRRAEEDLGASGRTSWTPLAIAFAAGMLAGAALTIAILRL